MSDTFKLNLCLSCMEEIENEIICPHCGANQNQIESLPFALRPGSLLQGRYLIGKALGQGGFGITYIGYDLVLQSKVAIKEYFPQGLVNRSENKSVVISWNQSQMSHTQKQAGCEALMAEARKMAKMDDVPSIVRVRDTFMANETAYIIMEYVKGQTLKAKLKENGTMSLEECLSILQPVMEGLSEVHKQGMIHRDISPDNIMIRTDGKVRLLDLGAAKDLTAKNHEFSTSVVKSGFSPIEQYKTKGNIGPWTDVYALCATIYYSLTGKLVPLAIDRIGDEELDFSSAKNLSTSVKKALQDGLAVQPKDRIQSVEELRERLEACKGDVGEDVVEETTEVVTVKVTEEIVEKEAVEESVEEKIPVVEVSPVEEADSVVEEPEIEKEVATEEAQTELKIEEKKLEAEPFMKEIVKGNEMAKTSDVKKSKEIKKKRKVSKKLILEVVGITLVVCACIWLFRPDFKYEKVDGGIITTKYRGRESIVEVPNKINDRQVIAIGEDTFRHNKKIQEIILPEGLQRIDDFSFDYCNLQKVSLPESLQTIGDWAFSNCENLKEIVLPENLTRIGQAVFSCCDSLQKVVLPEKLEMISEDMFLCCYALQEIVLPESLQIIGDDAFTHCSSLREIVLPESLQTIGDSAFSKCEDLQEIVLPEGLQSIGESVFKGCNNLRRVYVPQGFKLNRDYVSLENDVIVEYYSSEDNSVSKENFVLEQLEYKIINGKVIITGWKESEGILEIPDTIEGLPVMALEPFSLAGSSFQRIVLPEGINRIEDGMFYECENLQEIVLPTSVQTAGSYAFDFCYNLKKIYVPQGFEYDWDFAMIPEDTVIEYYSSREELDQKLDASDAIKSSTIKLN